MVMETHLISNAAAQLPTQFLGDTTGQGTCSNTPGLGMTDTPIDTAAQGQTDLWQLSGLTRPGLTADDHHLIGFNKGGDLFPKLGNR